MKIIKTKRLARILGCLLALGLTLSLATPALAVPQIPHQFWGTVTVGTEPAPVGTTVKAKIGEVYYVTTTVDAKGRYGYDPLFKVPAMTPVLLKRKVARMVRLLSFTSMMLWLPPSPSRLAVTTCLAYPSLMRRRHR